MRTLQHQQGQQGTSTTTRTTARLLLVIDWLPVFLPALLLIVLFIAGPGRFVVTFDFG